MTRAARNEQLGTFLLGSLPVALVLGWSLDPETLPALLTSGEPRFAVPRMVFGAALAGTLALAVAGLVGPGRPFGHVVTQRVVVMLLLAGIGAATPLVALLPLVVVRNPLGLLGAGGLLLVGITVPVGLAIYHVRRLWQAAARG